MRSTIHVVSARDYPLLAAGVRGARAEWWLRVNRRQLADLDVDAVVKRVSAELTSGPRRHADMLRLLESEGLPRIAWTTAVQLLDLVGVPPSGTWEHRRADLFGLAD